VVRIPLRAAAATSAPMIGVTASVGAIIARRRATRPGLAAAAVLGAQVGSAAAIHGRAGIGALAQDADGDRAFFAVSALMFVEGALMLSRIS
jgi:uncharacterized membrane protein YfcA